MINEARYRWKEASWGAMTPPYLILTNNQRWQFPHAKNSFCYVS